MRPSLSSITLLFAAAGSVLAKKVSYDGAKAVRIEVGEDVIGVYNIIHDLQLPTWKGVSKDGVPAAGGHVDLVVPADKVLKFKKLTKGLTVEVMHEDLGASIAAESGEGEVSTTKCKHFAIRYKYMANPLCSIGGKSRYHLV